MAFLTDQVKLLMFIPVRKLVLDLQVLFNRLLIRPGNPKCPKCLREGRLQGDGLAKSSHLVLDCDGQFRVFHFKLKCVGCPAHAAKGEWITAAAPAADVAAALRVLELHIGKYSLIAANRGYSF